MSTWVAVRCEECGGSVASPIGAPPACMFCGATRSCLEQEEIPEDVEQPDKFVPFAVDRDGASEQFRKFARSSFWYPTSIRNAPLQLQMLLLPAWALSAVVEMHWTGLTPAHTSSGSRPVSGSESLRWTEVLIPASSSLRAAELRQLGVFARETMQEWDPETHETPFELSEMTRTAAETKGRGEMERRHKARVKKAEGLTRVRTACLVTEMTGELALVPVFIGTYRYKNHPYRFLVNGQTGKLIGTAPTDWLKVFAVVGLTLLLILGLLGATVLFTAICGAVS